MRRTFCVLSALFLFSSVAFAQAPAPAPAPAKPAAPAKLSFEPSKVTISVKDSKVADLLKLLADKSGNPALVLPDGFVDKPVSIDLQNVTYFGALDRICAAAGLSYESKDGALSLASVPKLRDYSASPGPAVVKAAQILKNSSMRDQSNPRSTGMSLSLYYFWEPRLPVVSDDLEIVSATTAEGAALELRNPRQAFTRIGPFGSASTGLPSARDAHVNMQNLSGVASSSFNLNGFLRLTLGSGERTLALPGFLQEDKRSASDGEVSMKVTTVNQGPFGFIGNVAPSKAPQPMVSIQLTISRNDGSAVPLGMGNPYGLLLQDPKGKRYPTLALQGSQQEKDGNYTASIYVSFPKPEALTNEWSLVYVFPDRLESKEWPFELKNVPMP